MKRFLLFLIALAWAAQGLAAHGEVQLAEAVAAAHRAVAAEQVMATEAQSLENLNAAAREQVVGQLGLSAAQRKRFEPLYASYRAALDKAILSELPEKQDDAAQRLGIKRKLANIAAAAQVKHDYVDRFAELLTADQIRCLYNTEGQIGTNIKRAAGEASPVVSIRSNQPRELRGSGRLITRVWGPVADYRALVASQFIHAEISATARQITITADDNVIDYIVISTSSDGTLSLKIDVRSVSDITAKVIIPASQALRSITALGYGKVFSPLPLVGSDVKVSASGYGTVQADIDAGNAKIALSGYGKFAGKAKAGQCDLDVSGYASFEGGITAATCDLTNSGGGKVVAPIVCSGRCLVNVSGYGKITESISAQELSLVVAGGGSCKSDLTVGTLSLQTSGYGKFSGKIRARQLTLQSVGGASLDGALTGSVERLTASATGYGTISLVGEASVAEGRVDVSSGGKFFAPNLRMAVCNVESDSYGRAEVYCTDRLTIEASSGGKVLYGGGANCTVKSSSAANVRHR